MRIIFLFIRVKEDWLIQILFDIDKEFEDEYLKLCDRLSFPMNRKNNDTDINCYDIKRRKDDFRLIIVEGKSNYRLENL